MAEEILLIKWNEHQASLADNANYLFTSGAFTDCTLASGIEGEYLNVHKVVLCACSPYFRALLNQPFAEKHPIIIVRDVPFDELTFLVEYMYTGNVCVKISRIAGFLKSAEILQVKGLADQKTNQQVSPSPNEGQSTEQPKTKSATNAATELPIEIQGRKRKLKTKTRVGKVKQKSTVSKTIVQRSCSKIKTVRNVVSQQSRQVVIINAKNRHLYCPVKTDNSHIDLTVDDDYDISLPEMDSSIPSTSSNSRGNNEEVQNVPNNRNIIKDLSTISSSPPVSDGLKVPENGFLSSQDVCQSSAVESNANEKGLFDPKTTCKLITNKNTDESKPSLSNAAENKDYITTDVNNFDAESVEIMDTTWSGPMTRSRRNFNNILENGDVDNPTSNYIWIMLGDSSIESSGPNIRTPFKIKVVRKQRVHWTNKKKPEAAASPDPIAELPALEVRSEESESSLMQISNVNGAVNSSINQQMDDPSDDQQTSHCSSDEPALPIKSTSNQRATRRSLSRR